MKLKDKFYLGALYGLALPLLSYVLGDIVQKELGQFMRINLFYILCIALNVLIFRFALKRNFENLARGILLSTFVYAMFFAFYILKK